jgi:hypothetical protein
VRGGLESRLKALEARVGSRATVQQIYARRAWAASWEREVTAALKRAEEQGTRIIDQLDIELKIPPHAGVGAPDPETERSLEVVGRIMAQVVKEYEMEPPRVEDTASGR